MDKKTTGAPERKSVIDYFALGRCASIALTIYFAFYENHLCFLEMFHERFC